MSNVFREASATGAASGRGILARVAALVAVLAFALLTFADGSYATESELVPAAAPTDGKIVEVIIGNFTFAPKDLTMAPGNPFAGSEMRAQTCSRRFLEYEKRVAHARLDVPKSVRGVLKLAHQSVRPLLRSQARADFA